jgi:hypothetical protein
MIGGDVTVETFEQVKAQIGKPPPTEGCLVRFVSFQMDPARVDANLAYFNAEVLPAIAGSPGFRAVRNLIDRTTGRGLTAIIVSDEGALRAAEVGFRGAPRPGRGSRRPLWGDQPSRCRPGRQAEAPQVRPADGRDQGLGLTRG